MSDMHILTGTRRRTTILTRVAFHFVVPVEYRNANAALDCANLESAVPDINTTELDALRAGELVERVRVVRHTVNMNDAATLARARAIYADEEPKAVNDYRTKYWRYLETFASE